MTKAHVHLAFAFSALAFTACGGGGEGGTSGTTCATTPTDPSCTKTGPTPGTNTAPVAKANGPYQSVAGAAFSLSAAGSSDVEDAPATLKYEWLVGGSVVATGAQASHTFAAAGSYTITLRVTDTKGLTATDNAAVTISAPSVAAPGGPASGTMGIVLTDAPFPFDSVQAANVFVVRVDAQVAEPTADAANASLAETPNTDPNAGWVTVARPNVAINVFALQGGVTRSLGQGPAAAATYRGFRLVLDASKSNIVLKGGAMPAVQWGSAGLLGVKVAPAASVTIAANAATNVLVDFDLGRSFDLVGATPGGGFTYLRDFSLKTIAPNQTGSDVGRVQIQDGSATIFAPGVTVELLTNGTAEGDLARARVVSTAVTDAQGVYRLTNVLPGTYVRRFSFPDRYRVATSNSVVTIAAASASVAPAHTLVFEAAR